ncbi:hypothetical protein SLS60_010002 [Paraconiothyrium brasiliense]|uniref:MFS transporter n=1 Tax=Paraconiothyrium brasiliense TaxID=300254 RepID=A0ABR3QT27_9PLEO
MRLFQSTKNAEAQEVHDGIAPAPRGEKATGTDVVDGDAEVGAATHEQTIDPELEKRVRRKLDWHIIPLVSALYLLAFLDRSNIGNARIAGMTQDLDLDGGKYDWLLTIFYISYIVFEFQAIMWKLVPPHRWAAFVVFGWGLVSTVQAAIHTWEAEMALRFFMGMTEAGYGPGIPYLLSFFYLRHELGLRAGLFLSAAPLANTVGGVNWKEFWAGLADPKGWILGLMYFSCNVSFSSLPVFLPTILKEMGFSAINAQGLTAPPFFLSFLVTIITPYIADRTQQRGIMLVILTIIGGTGYVILAAAKSVGARYFGVFMAAAGIFPAIANILPWVLNNQGSDTRRGAGIVLLNVIGQCGPLLGTRMYPSNEGPFYVKGQSVCAAFMFFTTFLVIILRTLLVWENKKLDKQYGTLAQQKQAAQEAAQTAGGETKNEVAVENYGPLFRYVL